MVDDMRKLSILTTSAALALLAAGACSGGTESPTIHGLGPGSDESPKPRPPKGDDTPISTATGTPTPTTTSTTTSTNDTTTTSCLSCADILQDGYTGTPCADTVAVLQDLATCACVSCADECGTWCGAFPAIDSTCESCAESSCYTEYQDCVAD